ncbi:porin [Rhizobium sp. BK251]|uniref:porin n=1 Tax=Rhizobium sp. BK251 TaxID=2512125 RepID=UPI0010469C8E|nr:porin [Rhizobium sp. BK251]TCL70166.1 porin-like protein [Rhizobium sp. BK251]
MNIKSLLLGSAAALAVVSGAQAADAIVAAEPEPVEYVRVCDAYGTGYFYIPGTETCLQIGGWVRFQVNYGRDIAEGSDANSSGRGYFYLQTKNDTEYGTLTGFIAVEGDVSGQDASVNPYFDEAYLQLGGFKAGWFYNWWDKGINGEQDTLNSGGNEWVSVSYTYETDNFSIGGAVDELDRDGLSTVFAPGDPINDSNVVVEDSFDGIDYGFEGLITATFGGVSFDLLGSYDNFNEEGAIRALMSAELGPGTLQAALMWASGQNVYFDESEWSLAASYAYKVNDKLTITPGGQYFWQSSLDDDGSFEGGDTWDAGVTVDYRITEGLTSKISVQYNDLGDSDDDSVSGFFRLQRTF